MRFDKGSFCYLKKRIFISDTGKIVMRLARSNVTRQRRRLKHMKAKGIDISTSYVSWRGYADKYDTYKTVMEMDKIAEASD